MCRIFGFRSAVPSQAHRSLIAAENALSKQSREHPDGWGLAYYNAGYPHLYRNKDQAIDDVIFGRVSAVVSTHTLLAHIRRATSGEVNLFNCHPFQYGNWTFAHNGTILNCAIGSDIYNDILSRINPLFHRSIIGTTDSELLFYLFLSSLPLNHDTICDRVIEWPKVRDALKMAIESIQQLSLAKNNRLSTMTVIVTNGAIMAGLRCGRELNYSTYKKECPESATCPAYDRNLCEREVHQGLVRHLILSSEHVAANPNVWNCLQDGEMAAVDHNMMFTKISLLDPALSTFDASYQIGCR